MITESVEEYLEAVYRLHERGEIASTISITRELKVSPASATEMLQKLAKRGYLKYAPYRGVTLTSKGEKIGERLLRKHRVMEKFLSTLGLPKSEIHKNACELEHHISDGLERAIHLRIEKSRSRGKNRA